jgi:hypothetical protein
MTNFIYKNTKVELDGLDSHEGTLYGIGIYAMGAYEELMKGYIRPFDMLVGVAIEKEDTLGELTDFLNCMIHNPLNVIIMVDLSKVSIAQGIEFENKIKAFFDSLGTDEDGREWVDLKTYEDRVTYGLVNLID